MEEAPRIILMLILVLFLVFIGINAFVMPYLKTIEKVGEAEIDISGEKKDPVYTIIYNLCRMRAEKTEKIDLQKSKEAIEIAKTIQRAVDDCEVRAPSIVGRNAALKLPNCEPVSEDIQWNCGNNECAGIITINYDAELGADNIMFCDSDAT